MDGNEVLRVGIVGAGGIAPPHIEGWLALGADVGILRRTGAEELAARYGIGIVDDLDGLIAWSSIVDIISPTTTHLGIARRAFASRRHVVCEKPLALTAEEALTLTQEASDAGVRLFPAHVVRYFAGYQDLKERIDSIGAPVELTFRRTVAAPESAWFYAEDAGGGLIRDLMIHDLDQALWLAGPVVEVAATQDPPAVAGQVMPPVSAHVALTHANGAVSHLRADWFGPETTFRSRAEVVGTEGRLEFDTDGSAGRREGHLPPASDIDPYQAQLADFADAIRTGRDARVTPEDGIAAVRLVDAAYESLRTRRPVLL